MSISGTTNTCQILTNTQFVLSGLSQTNLSTINITNVNGLDVSECFGITSKIVTVTGDNVTLTGDCNTSLEINVTEGVTNEVVCLYTAFTQQQDGILLFEFVDGTISDNIHPDCCTALEYIPEIGPKQYYICRSIPETCITCCESYTPTNTVDENGYEQFTFVTGGTVTTVPSAECCYAYGFVESVVGGQIKCITYVEPDPCEGLNIVEPVPQYGDITFINPTTGVQTTLVPTAECCTSLGYSYAISGTKFTCFNSIAAPPTVTVTNDPCCLGTSTTQAYAKFACSQKRRYTSPCYTSPNFNLSKVQGGTKIRFYLNFSANGSIAYNVTYDKTVTATQDYATVQAWFQAEIESLSTFTSFANSYTKVYGFTAGSTQFFVESHRNGTASRDVNTNVSFEFGV